VFTSLILILIEEHYFLHMQMILWLLGRRIHFARSYCFDDFDPKFSTSFAGLESVESPNQSLLILSIQSGVIP